SRVASRRAPPHTPALPLHHPLPISGPNQARVAPPPLEERECHAGAARGNQYVDPHVIGRDKGAEFLARNVDGVVDSAATETEDRPQPEDKQAPLLGPVATTLLPKEYRPRNGEEHPDQVRPGLGGFAELEKRVSERVFGGGVHLSKGDFAGPI